MNLDWCLWWHWGLVVKYINVWINWVQPLSPSACTKVQTSNFILTVQHFFFMNQNKWEKNVTKMCFIFIFQGNLVNVMPVMFPVWPALAQSHWIVLFVSEVGRFKDKAYVQTMTVGFDSLFTCVCPRVFPGPGRLMCVTVPDRLLLQLRHRPVWGLLSKLWALCWHQR